MPDSKISRDEVYAAIDGERDYQDALPPSRTDGKVKTVGDYLTLARVCLNRADADYTGNPGDLQALDELRKVAALIVHCLEVHGCPQRGEVEAIEKAESDARLARCMESLKLSVPFVPSASSSSSLGYEQP
jgi:hypothetical protein